MPVPVAAKSKRLECVSKLNLSATLHASISVLRGLHGDKTKRTLAPFLSSKTKRACHGHTKRASTALRGLNGTPRQPLGSLLVKLNGPFRLLMRRTWGTLSARFIFLFSKRYCVRFKGSNTGSLWAILFYELPPLL